MWAGDIDNYVWDNNEWVPAGCLGVVKKQYSDEELKKDPDKEARMAAVMANIKSGYYMQEAIKNPSPDRYDSAGNLIPPGCIGKTASKRRRTSAPQEVLEKIEAGYYKEQAENRLAEQKKAENAHKTVESAYEDMKSFLGDAG